MSDSMRNWSCNITKFSGRVDEAATSFMPLMVNTSVPSHFLAIGVSAITMGGS